MLDVWLPCHRVSCPLCQSESSIRGTDQWGGREVAHNVTMVTRYLETSRGSHATEHQRYLQMVKNIFISRPKYVPTLMNICLHMLLGWNGRPGNWEKHFVGHLASGQLVFSLCLSAYNWLSPSQHNKKTFKRSPPSLVHRAAPPTEAAKHFSPWEANAECSTKCPTHPPGWGSLWFQSFTWFLDGFCNFCKLQGTISSFLKHKG